MRVGALVLIASSFLLACSSTSSRRVVGEQCDKHSDCDVPLVCRLGYCRTECRSSADCIAPRLCVLDEVQDGHKIGSCQLDAETSCTLQTECPDPLVCRFQSCVNECATDRDCLPGAACEDGACHEPAIRSCAGDGDCPPEEACRAGRCRPECREDRDCRNGRVCQLISAEFGRCDPPPMDAGMDTAVPDSSVPRCGEAMAAPLRASTVIATGDDHTCTVATVPGMATDSVVCWGPNSPILGADGPARSPRCPVVVRDIDGADVVELALGSVHACARMRTTGEVLCWGSNTLGVLGLGAGAPDTPMPTLVPGVAGARSLVAGSSHTCVTRLGMNAQCWGNAAQGQLGSAFMGTQPSQIEVADVPMALYAGIGLNLTCMGNVATPPDCFGQDSFNQRGTSLGTMMMGGGTVVAGSSHTCAIDADPTGQVFCWGDPSNGRLGIPAGDGMSRQPVPGLTATDLTAGFFHTCARLPDGSVRCWGLNNAGQVQPGGALDIVTPVEPVAGLTAVFDLSAGLRHTCVLTVAGQVRCWGANANGALGDGTMTSTTDTFTTVLTP